MKEDSQEMKADLEIQDEEKKNEILDNPKGGFLETENFEQKEDKKKHPTQNFDLKENNKYIHIS